MIYIIMLYIIDRR